MKRCPTCNQSFQDTLAFCPTDKSVLENVREGAAAGNARASAHGLPAAKGPAQFDLDTQGKETGKFNIKDVDGWGAMIKSVSAAAGKPASAKADSGSPKQPVAGKGGAAHTPDPAPVEPQALAKAPPAPATAPKGVSAFRNSSPSVALPVNVAVPPEPSMVPPTAVPANRPPDLRETIIEPHLNAAQFRETIIEPHLNAAQLEQLTREQQPEVSRFAGEIERLDSIRSSARPNIPEPGPQKARSSNMKLSRSITPEKRSIPVMRILSVIVVLVLLAGVVAFLFGHH